MKADNTITIAQPQAAPVIATALATLDMASHYAKTMISEELQLAAQIAELKKTETVLQAMLSEMTRERTGMERRQGAVTAARSARY
jgi:hypothetical protein